LKSFKKISLRFIKFALIAILSLYVGLFLYFQFGWRNHYSKYQVDNIISTVQKTPPLSDSFYILYDKIYSDRHEKITDRYLKNFWTEFISMQQPIQDNWQFVTANMNPYNGFRYKVAPMTLAFRINSDLSSEKCFDYVMTERFKNYCKEFNINDSIINLAYADRIISFLVTNRRPKYFYKTHPTQYKIETDSLKLLILNR